jgi:hypothetical protein
LLKEFSGGRSWLSRMGTDYERNLLVEHCSRKAAVRFSGKNKADGL